MGLLLFFVVICQLILIQYWQTADSTEQTQDRLTAKDEESSNTEKTQ